MFSQAKFAYGMDLWEFVGSGNRHRNPNGEDTCCCLSLSVKVKVVLRFALRDVIVKVSE